MAKLNFYRKSIELFVLCFDWQQGFVADVTFAALFWNVKPNTNICGVPGLGALEQI